ncbi:hypothetical protein AAC387_Pa04g0416 [Persea americana]
MVIPLPVRPPRIINFLKPYVLKMHFTNKYVSAQVIHSPTATVASSASSQEKLLRPTMESSRDVAAAAKIGKILGERLLLKDIPAVTVFLKREQKYHGKVKAVIDSLRETGTISIWNINVAFFFCNGSGDPKAPLGASVLLFLTVASLQLLSPNSFVCFPPLKTSFQNPMNLKN